ncbi:hypothetical protein LXL04_021372 [Taraxacum kok-saghyz]
MRKSRSFFKFIPMVSRAAFVISETYTAIYSKSRHPCAIANPLCETTPSSSSISCSSAPRSIRSRFSNFIKFGWMFTELSFSVSFQFSNSSVQELTRAVMEKKGVPDIIVNNAGTINKNNRLWEVPEEEFNAVIDTNLKGVANILCHFIPLMIENFHSPVSNHVSCLQFHQI